MGKRAKKPAATTKPTKGKRPSRFAGMFDPVAKVGPVKPNKGKRPSRFAGMFD